MKPYRFHWFIFINVSYTKYGSLALTLSYNDSRQKCQLILSLNYRCRLTHSVQYDHSNHTAEPQPSNSHSKEADAIHTYRKGQCHHHLTPFSNGYTLSGSATFLFRYFSLFSLAIIFFPVAKSNLFVTSLTL